METMSLNWHKYANQIDHRGQEVNWNFQIRSMINREDEVAKFCYSKDSKQVLYHTPLCL